MTLSNLPQRDEINVLRTTKPNYAERRIVSDCAELEEFPGSENNNEEKKMDDSAAVIASEDSENETSISVKSSESIDSAASDDVVTVVHETMSTDASDSQANNNAENNENGEGDTSVDSSEAVSLFTRLLSISNKTGAQSGTVTLSTAATASNPNDDDENKVITPTIMQNGRPVS